MKRLAYLRSEAAESVDDFESAVKDIEGQIGKDKPGEPQATVGVDSTSSAASESSLDIVPSKLKDDRTRVKVGVGEKLSEEICDSNDQDSLEDPATIQYKKLWRAIARLTHPDVVGDDPEMMILYKAAASAAERRKWEELLDISSELCVPLSDPHPVLLAGADKRCVYYENMIRKVRSSVAWQWKHSGDEAKAEIVDLILRSRDKKDC